MEAVVDEPLRHVVDGHAGVPGQPADVEDALVRHQVSVAAVEHGEVLAQPGGHVVGGEDRAGRGPGEALGAHQPDVRPRDRQDARRTERRRADRADPGALGRVGVHPVRGQVRREVGADRHGPDARTAPAVRDAEGLVQVEVRHVAPELAGLGVAQQRVEVGTVDVHLTAVVVHDLAEVGDGVLVGPVRGRVGHHDRGEVVGMRVALRAQVVEVDRSVVTGLHHDHPHAGHDRRGGIGAVRRRGDQADVALEVAVGPVEGADGQQAGQLALRAGVGLDRDRVVARHLGQPGLQLSDQLHVALGVLRRSERVQVREARQRHRLHLRGRVELHRAGTQRDHASVQCVVPRREAAQVAQHLGLAVVAGEDLVGEVGRRAGQPGGHPLDRLGRRRGDPERGMDPPQCPGGADLGERQADGVLVDEQQVQPLGARCGDDLARPTGGSHLEGVEEVRGAHVEPGGRQGGGGPARQVVGARRDRPQPRGAVVDGVHRGDDREQHLRGADVGGRLVPADVLLAGLERQPVGRTPLRVDRDADEATREVPFEAGGH